MAQTGQARGQWGSKLGFILAAAGSAVGLGNMWKFPYMTYSNNGGAFVLVYLICVLAIGVPIIIAELVIGRSTQLNPVGAMRKLAGKNWTWLGWLGVITGFVILSYYSVVAGWTLEYLMKSVLNAFSGKLPGEVTQMFTDFLLSPWKVVFWHAVFMGITTFVVMGGVHGGIERASKILMPSLFVLMLILVVNALMTTGAGEALRFLFYPNFGELGFSGVLSAMGQAFFSLSLGMGMMITYGSYMEKSASIPKAAVIVALLDTLIAILACFMIFPIIFSYQLDTTESIGILFTTLPVVFLKMPGGTIVSALFFLLIAFAALTSTISLLEVVVAYFIDEKKWQRKKAALTLGSITFVFGVLSALSLGSNDFLTNISPLSLIIKENPPVGVLATLDYLASNLMLPIGGLFIAIFTGWLLSKVIIKAEVGQEEGGLYNYKVWLILVRYVAPVAVTAIIISILFFSES